MQNHASHIVTYGSIASTLGSVGQASYAAANSALEAAAAGLRSRGLHALHISWGAWGGIGMAASDATLEPKLRLVGVAMMPPGAGLRALMVAAAATHPQGGVRMVADLQWSKALAAGTGSADFYSLVREEASEEEQQHASIRAAPAPTVVHEGRVQPALQTRPAALPKTNVEEVVRQTLDQIMGRSVAGDEPLVAAGLDSIGTVEVQTRLEKATGVALPATLVFDYPTANSLVAHLKDKVTAKEVAEEAAREAAAAAASLAEVQASPRLGAALPLPAEERLPLAPFAQNKQMVPVTINPNCPLLTKSGYFTAPSIRRLQHMSDDELAAVPRFVIGRANVGEVAFLYPVDLRGANLDKIVSIERGNISLYPAEGSRAAPGCGLNQPALLTYRHIYPRGKKSSRASRNALKLLLLRACTRIGATFVHYDDEEGIWISKVDCW